MALGNQRSGGLRGTDELSYQGNTPNMVFNSRRPTPQDFQGFNLGCWWILPNGPIGTTAPNPIQKEIWVLVGKQQGLATWKRLHGSGSGPVSESGVNKIYITTLGAGTYTPTEGMTSCLVECQGGGSGADGADFNSGTGNAAAGYSGSSGGYCQKMFTAEEIGASKSYVVGSGGASGSNGGDTTFGSILSAGGGIAGFAQSGPGNILPVGGIATGGDLNVDGEPGMYFVGITIVTIPQVWAITYSGANSVLGIGGSVGTQYQGSFNGQNGSGYGSGGGAAGVPTSTGSSNGGSGAQGIIIITEYIS